jgi:hypothetical protein
MRLGLVQGGCDYQFPLFGQTVVIGAFADYDWSWSLHQPVEPKRISISLISSPA